MRPDWHRSILARRSWKNKRKCKKTYNIKQLAAAENYLLERLSHIDELLNQMTDDVTNYHAKQDEMEAWRINVDERIRVARNAISVWGQSHRNLGSGIPVPPLIDVAGIAAGIAGTAVGTMVP